MMKVLNVFAVLVTLFLLGCQTPSKQPTAVNNVSNDTTVEIGIPFKGKVVYEQLEGGFWGIIAEDGTKLDGQIPAELQQKGLAVEGRYKPLKDTASFHMWGTLVNFVALKRI